MTVKEKVIIVNFKSYAKKMYIFNHFLFLKRKHMYLFPYICMNYPLNYIQRNLIIGIALGGGVSGWIGENSMRDTSLYTFHIIFYKINK